MPTRKFDFETSPVLKQLLAEHFEQWRKRHGGDLVDLAERCGVSPAYLAHVRRYGRIPSRPVLILLAFNFKIDGQKLFEAARADAPFPYESGLQIARPSADEAGLFSLRFNMEGFTDTIRTIVRTEIRQRSVKDLLGNRPLRVGMNYHQYWLFGSQHPPTDGKHIGIFPEFCGMLGLALQKDVELVYVPFANYIEMLKNGQLDLFGPTMIVPNLPAQILFTTPIFRLGVSAIFRKRATQDLEELQPPRQVEDLRDERYKIVVLKNSLHHLVANTLLKRSDSSLILCSSDEEGIERITLRGISRAAHVYITNSVTAMLAAREQPKAMQLMFATRKTLLDLAENSIAVRPDWPELVPVINDAIRFLQARGGFSERLAKMHSGDMAEVVEL